MNYFKKTYGFNNAIEKEVRKPDSLFVEVVKAA